MKAGGWRAEVQRRGVRESAVFRTKGEAVQWALAREQVLLAGGRGAAAAPRMTLGQALARYEDEVLARRPAAAARPDRLRLAAFRRDFPQLCALPLADVRAGDIAAWRDARLQKVSAATVQREAAALRPMWRLAVGEWEAVERSPWQGVRLPPEPPARTRLPSWREVRRMLRAGGVHLGLPPATAMQEALWAWVVALHTALRSAEVLRMARSNVDLQRRVYRLEQHKTARLVGARLVPLTPRAARVLQVLDAAAAAAGRDGYFTLSDASRDVLWRRVAQGAGVQGLHFHDARAAALTWLAKRYDVMTLARISGHRNINMLYNTYYRESAADVAARL